MVQVYILHEQMVEDLLRYTSKLEFWKFFLLFYFSESFNYILKLNSVTINTKFETEDNISILVKVYVTSKHDITSC